MAGKPAITKVEILDVAYARAQQDGLGGLSIRSVARECGVAVGTLYNFFPIKHRLFRQSFCVSGALFQKVAKAISCRAKAH